MLTRFLAAALVLLVGVLPAWALSFQSADDQTFNRHQSFEQVRDITITATAASEITTTTGIRITIPADFPAIWDDRTTTATVYGSAVTAGRLAADSVSVSYTDKDKTAVIPVKQDFLAGESVTISKLFLEGFYSSSDSRYLTLTTSSGTVLATNSKYLAVRTSSYEDTQAPAMPTNIKLVQNEEGSVMLSWTDPTDMDLTFVEVLRGVSPQAVSGTVHASVPKGTQKLVETGFKVGDTVSYILRATDGRNTSALTTEVKITLVVYAAPTTTPTACTMEYAPVCGSDSKTYSNSCTAKAAGITSYTSGECATTTTPAPTTTTDAELTAKAIAAGVTTTQIQSTLTKFADLSSGHFAVGFLSRLTSDGVLSGYPDGTVQPDRKLNRAELAKIAVIAFDLDKLTPAVAADYVPPKDFADVPSTAWYAPFVGELAMVKATWTDGPAAYYPAAEVSRAEAVWTLVRAAGAVSPDATTSERPFPDVSPAHRYAAAISWAAQHGVVSGYESGLFGPADTLTRSQVAKIVVLLKKALGK